MSMEDDKDWKVAKAWALAEEMKRRAKQELADWADSAVDAFDDREDAAAMGILHRMHDEARASFMAWRALERTARELEAGKEVGS
jgi:hypothetical protein